MIGYTEHITEDGVNDDDGFYQATCRCGYLSVPCPDLETLVDEMMAHVSQVVQEDADAEM